MNNILMRYEESPISYIKKFDYTLPESHIAHQPASPRDSSRLLVINRNQNSLSHRLFYELPELLDNNSLLVLNDTKVYPARLFGKKPTGGKVELLLVKKLANNTWEALSSPGLAPGTMVNFGHFTIKVLQKKRARNYYPAGQTRTGLFTDHRKDRGDTYAALYKNKLTASVP